MHRYLVFRETEGNKQNMFFLTPSLWFYRNALGRVPGNVREQLNLSVREQLGQLKDKY